MRHSEPQRMDFDTLGLIGFGRDLMPLSSQGIAIADKAAKNSILFDAELIVSSPLTRALQTAGIVARHTGLLIEVEFGLIERCFDLTQKLSACELEPLYDEYENLCGTWPENKKCNWESITMQHERLKTALNKYLHYKKIIVVAHGEIGRRFRKGKRGYCEMFEFDYTPNFKLLPYSDREEY